MRPVTVSSFLRGPAVLEWAWGAATCLHLSAMPDRIAEGDPRLTGGRSPVGRPIG